MSARRAGRGFVIARRDALNMRKPHVLSRHHAPGQIAGRAPHAFTPSCMRITRWWRRCAEFEEEGGLLARHARYAALAEQVRCGLAALGY